MAIKGLYICVTWDEIAESFVWQKCLILSKDNERDSKRTSLSNALSKEILDQTLAKSIRILT